MNGYLFSHFSLSDLFPREYKFSTFYFLGAREDILTNPFPFPLKHFRHGLKIDDRFIPYAFFAVLLNIFTSMHRLYVTQWL